jgi:hypothetical protein
VPAYKVNALNSFQIGKRLFFVARTRYMDDGMQVFECTQNGAIKINGFWDVLLLPDHQRRIPCREVARRLVTAWIECGEWVPNLEQRQAVAQATDHESWWIDEGRFYRKWFAHFHTHTCANLPIAGNVRTMSNPPRSRLPFSELPFSDRHLPSRIPITLAIH